ncbi:hypothetical protein J1N35_038793 [Gossypium stocksii]|uniref:Reverse transcriptase domain-containing protein n=1 Tax=Gossypium stocksii TaxID=47602 RepID=A0A9D3UNF5_9ROSI|nr:hypothetical protein J1N35_038793 [Gossypium stocksii]
MPRIAQSVSSVCVNETEAFGPVNGCASSKFLRASHEYKFEYKPDIVCLLEPRISGKKANDIIDKLGFDFSHRIESIGFLGGIWVGWNDNICIDIIHNHPQFMLLRNQGNNAFNSFFAFVVYGSPDRTKRKALWTDLMEVLPPNPSSWLILGDFNAILSTKDKKSDRSMGPAFTWQRGNTHERIDRALANDSWISSFPHTLVYYLPHIKSDHRPILIKTNLDLSLSKGRPFRFLAVWTMHDNFKELVTTKWRFTGNMANSLLDFTSHVKDWNRSVYGFIGTRKRQLLRSLGNFQKAMDWSSSSRLAELEMEVRDELENVLNHEELLWRQKARCDWLQFGDRNTKYFHSRTMQRQKANRIMSLRTSSGEWSTDQNFLREEVVRFFEKLYGETPSHEYSSYDLFPRLAVDDIDFLSKPILNDEIKKAFFDMALLKAPGSNGFHAYFFQSQWDSVREAVCEWVKGIFNSNKIEENLNNMMIVLIPKIECPEDFSQFRPISLCSVMHKLVMKVIANRFKVVFPNYISSEQAAYDKISWDFLDETLVAAGIPEFLRKLRHIIHSEISAGKWQQIRLSRSGPSLSYLFFADDLFIFAKAEMDQVILLKDILKHFYDFSGLKISARKSNIHFSKCVDDGLCDQISLFFGFQKTSNLGRSREGLGFRHLHDQNNSFLMKIGFNLISRPDALWVWPLFCENLIWSVGDGSTIRGWEDSWIPDMGPLISYALAHYSLDLECTLKDWMLPNGNWNLDLLRSWLPDDVIKRIGSVPPPHPDGRADRIIWARSGLGNFSVRSACWASKENSWNSYDDAWKIIWKYKGPQRVRLFLWLIAKQRLLTNSERARRGIGHSSACPFLWA